MVRTIEDKGHWGGKKDKDKDIFREVKRVQNRELIKLAYLDILTLEKVFGPQNVALGKVYETLASPQYSNRERFREDAA